MYPKLFHETFMEGDPRNELFVCMPFHESLNEKFEIIKNVASDIEPKLESKRVDCDPTGYDITHKIFDGIANSKLLLFDLSDDPKTPCEYSRKVNENVMYELGIATTIRAPQSIILIRDESSRSKIPFNIEQSSINYHGSSFKKEELVKILKEALAYEKFYNERLIKIAARSIDEIGFELMYEFGRSGKGNDNFGLKDCSPQQKMAAFRLMDLHILWFAVEPHGEIGNFWYSCHWTVFGYEVMKYLKVILQY